MGLPDLEAISDETLQALDAGTDTLALDGLTALSPAQVAILGALEPPRGRSASPPVPDAGLSLRGVGGLDPAALSVLADGNRALWLSFPGGLDAAAADALVGGRVQGLHLHGLPDLDPDVARRLVASGVQTLFIEVERLEEESAAALGGFEGEQLELVVREGFGARAAEGLARIASRGSAHPGHRRRGRVVVPALPVGFDPIDAEVPEIGQRVTQGAQLPVEHRDRSCPVRGVHDVADAAVAPGDRRRGFLRPVPLEPVEGRFDHRKVPPATGDDPVVEGALVGEVSTQRGVAESVRQFEEGRASVGDVDVVHLGEHPDALVLQRPSGGRV